MRPRAAAACNSATRVKPTHTHLGGHWRDAGEVGKGVLPFCGCRPERGRCRQGVLGPPLLRLGACCWPRGKGCLIAKFAADLHVMMARATAGMCSGVTTWGASSCVCGRAAACDSMHCLRCCCCCGQLCMLFARGWPGIGAPACTTRSAAAAETARAPPSQTDCCRGAGLPPLQAGPRSAGAWNQLLEAWDGPRDGPIASRMPRLGSDWGVGARREEVPTWAGPNPDCLAPSPR